MAAIITSTRATVYWNGKTASVDVTHPEYDAIMLAITSRNYARAFDMINKKEAVKQYLTLANFKMDANTLWYKGTTVPGSIVPLIMKMRDQGHEATPFLKFIEKVFANPLESAKKELFEFLETANLPICDDGDFLAFKCVKEDGKDFYTGKIDHVIGVPIEMDRNKCDTSRTNTCSVGLHFCSFDYLPHYYGNEGRIFVMKVNPSDVTAIPSDYNKQKGRCCKYVPFDEIQLDDARNGFESVVVVGAESEGPYDQRAPADSPETSASPSDVPKDFIVALWKMKRKHSVLHDIQTMVSFLHANKERGWTCTDLGVKALHLDPSDAAKRIDYLLKVVECLPDELRPLAFRIDDVEWKLWYRHAPKYLIYAK